MGNDYKKTPPNTQGKECPAELKIYKQTKNPFSSDSPDGRIQTGKVLFSLTKGPERWDRWNLLALSLMLSK